jgi:hypothetical protein
MERAFVNGTEIRITGMSRSGNHAFINWVLHQVPGRYCFLNCCEGKANPFATPREMDDGQRFRTNIGGFDLERERGGAHQRKDWLLFSYEDNFLGNAFSPLFEREHDRWVGRSARRVDVLLLRDPYNLFASRLGRNWTHMSLATAARIWKQHARAFGGPRPSPPLLSVSYNRWVADRSYRGRVARTLGFPFTDAGIDRVPSCAGGSSFDGLSFDGAARRMRVLERWRAWVHEPAYRAVFDARMVQLSRRVFGAMPAVERALGFE